MGKGRRGIAALGLALAVALGSPVAAGASSRGWAEGELIVAVAGGGSIEDVLDRIDDGIEYPRIGFPDIPNPNGPRAGTEELDRLIATCQPYYEVSLPDLHLLRFDSDAQAGAALRALRADEGVAFAQRNYLVDTRSDLPLPDDELFPQQWGLRNTGQGPPNGLWGDPVPDSDIDAPEAWATGALGQGVTVAVLDTGVDYLHPDLDDNIWHNEGEMGADAQGRDRRSNEVDDDDNGYVDDWRGWRVVAYPPNQWGPGAPNNDPRGIGHGTHVAGIVAAERNNGIGIAGVAPEAELMAVATLNSSIPDTLEAIGGFAYAIRNGADVINNSWGFIVPAGHGSPLVSLAVDCANRAGIVISWAGGNFFGYPDANPAYNPALNVLVVGNHDRYDQRHLTSHAIIALQDVMAPGEGILSTWNYPATPYSEQGGTSMAAPHVAGVAALVLSQHPDLEPYEAKWFIKQGVEFSATLAPYSSSLGRLDADGALAEAAKPGPIPPLPDP